MDEPPQTVISPEANMIKTTIIQRFFKKRAMSYEAIHKGMNRVRWTQESCAERSANKSEIKSATFV